MQGFILGTKWNDNELAIITIFLLKNNLCEFTKHTKTFKRLICSKKHVLKASLKDF